MRLADLRARGSPTIGRRLLERGLIDEIDLHIAPVLLGDGIRLFDKPWGDPVRLELLNGDDPSEESPNHPRELMRAAPSETSRSDKALLQTVVESDNAEGAARVV